MQFYSRAAPRTKAGWVSILLSILVIVPLGFYTKTYRGPASDWVNHSLGGTFYVMFWCLAARFLLPKTSAARIAVAVLAATCCIEFLQLWHPPFLEMLRSHFIGAAILGNTFDWFDFPSYFLGAGIAWLWLRLLPA